MPIYESKYKSKWTLLAATTILSGLTTAVLANEVVISNTSKYSIPVRYQIAEHTPGKPVVLGEKVQTVIRGYSKLGVYIPQVHNKGEYKIGDYNKGDYKNVGLVVYAVKFQERGNEWVTLPARAIQFDRNPGCWASTNRHNTTSGFVISKIVYRSQYGGKHSGKHGRLSCSK